jgi:pyruvate dehydrogenase E2 component (dihydrolipoamide acetyltransferase)
MRYNDWLRRPMENADVYLFRLPKLYENMDEATIGEWLIAEGATVDEGQPLVELITDKTVLEYESPCAGTLLKIYAPVRSVIPTTYAMAAIGPADGFIPDVAAENKQLLAAAVDVGASAPSVVDPVTPRQRTGRLRVAPAARVLAKKENVDLDEVAKFAAGDVIHRKDIEAYLESTRNE